MHFDEEMGFQFLGPRSTVLSPSDPRPPTVMDGSFVSCVPQLKLSLHEHVLSSESGCQVHFSWQAQRFERYDFSWQKQHFEHVMILFVAGAAL